MNYSPSKFVGFALLAIVAFPNILIVAATAPHSSNELRCETNDAIRKAVERLHDAASFHSVLSSLTGTPASGACQLIKTLRVLSDKTLLPDEQRSRPETMQVIWSLRALCSITGGSRFTAGTQYPFNLAEEAEGRRRDFLRARDGELRFFAVWMSRDVLYIAPRDVQAAIIDKWINWYTANGQTFHYTSPDGWEACYF